jgi:O-antigen/teichoic acid export membrane protein
LPYLAAFVAAGYALRTILVHRVAPTSRPASRIHVAKEFWKFSIPRAFAGVAQILLQRMDIVLVAVMRGAAAAAVYTAATRFLVVGQFVNQAISAPLQPRLSAALSTGAHERARSLYRATTAWIVLATWPLFGAMIVLAGWYLNAFGSKYSHGGAVVVLLSVAMLVASATGPVDNVIIMAGKASWNLMTTMLALVVNLGLDLVLIPHFGLVGAAIAWCGAIVANNVVPLIVAWTKLGLNPYGSATGLACGLCAACFLVLPLAGRAVAGNTGAMVGLLIGACGYAFGVIAYRRVLDLSELSSFVRRRRSAVTA